VGVFKAYVPRLVPRCPNVGVFKAYVQFVIPLCASAGECD